MVFRLACGTLNAGRSLCTVACTQGENYNLVRNAYYYCYYEYYYYYYYYYSYDDDYYYYDYDYDYIFPAATSVRTDATNPSYL